MTVVLEGTIIHLRGPCRVEEAETLTTLLLSRPDATLDMSACTSLHAAVLQVMLAFAPNITGEPDDTFLRDHLFPSLVARHGRKADAHSEFQPSSAHDQSAEE